MTEASYRGMIINYARQAIQTSGAGQVVTNNNKLETHEIESDASDTQRDDYPLRDSI